MMPHGTLRVLVLRPLAQPRLLGRLQRLAQRRLEQRGHRDLEGGAARQPAAQRHVRDHQRVQRRCDQAARAEAGDDAAHVVRPARPPGTGVAASGMSTDWSIAALWRRSAPAFAATGGGAGAAAITV